jgi:O-succinylbenzoate synthase
VGGVTRAFGIPMRIPFRGLRERVGLLIEGPCGWGEFSPFSDYSPERTARWLKAALESTTREWPSPVRKSIPVNAIVPAVSAVDAYELAAESGCTTVKVKVGDDGDEARVEAVRDALGSGGRVRIDANGAWDVDTAARKIRALARFDLEYVEQPVATLDDMALLRRRIDVPLAVDESIRLADDPGRIAALGIADVAVLKVHPLGGVWACLDIAEALGLPVVVSSALETSVGLSAGIALAAALPDLPYACGLATATLLDGDVVADPLVPMSGAIEVRRPSVSQDALRIHAIADERAATLRSRLRDAEDLLGARR